MYADVEIISNNTYKNMLFTYRVPPELASKVVKGSIVSVPFRNREYKAVVLATSSSTNVKKIKDLKKYLNITLTKNHLIYLEQLAISNKLNIGILIHNLFDLQTFIDQKTLKNRKIKNIQISNLEEILNNGNQNVLFVPSLKIAKELNDRLKNITEINFFQIFGGKDEFKDKYKKNFKNIILLNTNFEKIILNANTNYIFYDSNHPAWKLPKLNNFNMTEAAYLKQNIFGGSFFFVNEFPNLEFHNISYDYQGVHDYNIEYFIGNTIKDCLNVYTHKYFEKRLNVYSNSPIEDSNLFNYADKVTDLNIDAILLINPTLVTNNVINSYKVIYLLSILNHAKSNNIRTIVFSTNELDINKVLNSKSMNKWIKKEQTTRSKYGPSLLNKIFTFKTTKILIGLNEAYLRGPIEIKDGFTYEINIDLDKSYDYLEIMKMYKDLQDYDLNRARFI
jgi:hypothetical protein